jgi:hypothetical protein
LDQQLVWLDHVVANALVQAAANAMTAANAMLVFMDLVAAGGRPGLRARQAWRRCP